MPRRRTTTGSLSEVARHLVLPSGIVSTGWPSVRDTAAGFGVTFDPWQDGAGRVILAKRADGSYACTVGGVVLSIPRQVGKTFLIGAIIFALCLLNPGTTVLWTAHRVRTANETFQKMRAFSLRPKVRPHVDDPVLANGEQTIKFFNGSRILFGARERGFGRGFDDVDIVVFDEGQILTENAIDDMLPATLVARNPLVFFVGTPPKPSDPSEVFRAKRDDALSGEDEDTALIEFSADPGADPEDRKQWAKANPSFPGRTSESAILRLKKNLTPESFAREVLGLWDEDDADEIPSAIDMDRWARLHGTAPDGVAVFGVKFSADGASVALAGAIRPETGPLHIEGIDHRPVAAGTKWLVDFLAARKALVVIDGRAGSGALAAALRRAKVPTSRVKRPTTDEAITAHAGFVEAVRAGDITQPDDDALTEAAEVAVRRPIGNQGGWGFQGRTPDDDVTLIESAVLAHWGANTKKKRRGRSSSGNRRAIVPA